MKPPSFDEDKFEAERRISEAFKNSPEGKKAIIKMTKVIKSQKTEADKLVKNEQRSSRTKQPVKRGRAKTNK